MGDDFEDHVLDTERVELRRGPELVELEPQVFDLLAYLIQNQGPGDQQRMRCLMRCGRGALFRSQPAVPADINAARKAIGDSGAEQKLIKTIPRKGYRFTGQATSLAAEDQAVEPQQPESGSPPGTATTLNFGQ